MADNLLFTYTTPYLDKGEIDPRAAVGVNYRFVTTYGQGFIEWSLSIRRPRRIGNTNAQIELICRNFRSILPATASSCQFTLVKRTDNKTRTLAEQTILGETEGATTLTTRFMIRGQNLFSVPLKFATTQNTIQMVVCLSLPRKDFEADNWTLPVPPTPLQLDWTFEPMEDKSQLDKKIFCTNGEYMVNGEALWRAAPGLRAMVEGPEDMRVDCSVQTAKTLVTYALTYTYLAPPHYDSQQMMELLNFAKKSLVQERNQFFAAVELSVCQHLETMDLQSLLELFITAIESRLDRIETSITAVILAKHYMDLHTSVMGMKTDLAERMKRRSSQRAQSPISRLEDQWLKQSCVLVVERAHQIK